VKLYSFKYKGRLQLPKKIFAWEFNSTTKAARFTLILSLFIIKVPFTGLFGSGKASGLKVVLPGST
jgi:hypothetical protein